MEEIDKKDAEVFIRKVGEKEQIKLKARKDNKRSVWFGLGMFGMVGWSVASTSLLGAALGIWLDELYPEPFSWTLSFLLLGLLAGSLIAWHWVKKEEKEMHQDKGENDD